MLTMASGNSTSTAAGINLFAVSDVPEGPAVDHMHWYFAKGSEQAHRMLAGTAILPALLPVHRAATWSTWMHPEDWLCPVALIHRLCMGRQKTSLEPPDEPLKSSPSAPKLPSPKEYTCRAPYLACIQ
jgi:hypothetical protein